MRTVWEIEDELEFHKEQGSIGAVMDLVDELGNMSDLLCNAIASDKLDMVAELGEFGLDLTSPLYLSVAAANGRCEIIRYLVECGVNVRTDSEALGYAVSNGHTDAIQCLVTLGADIRAENDKAVKAAIEAAAAHKHSFEQSVAIICCLLELGAGIDAVIEWAKKASNTELLEWANSYKQAKELRDSLEKNLVNGETKAPKQKV